MTTKKLRAAAVQLAVGVNLQDNLQTCLRMIDEAVRHEPELVVLPEFCNHLSWYDDREHCERVAVTLAGDFLATLAAAARRHRLHLVVNVTLRRRPGRVTDTSLLYGPEGKLLASADKQVLIGHENDFFARAQAPSPIVQTPIGRLGLYACMDGVICETPRALALQGAQVLCNSLNSFARDEASLHVPVRAAENRVFVVAANKVGLLVPESVVDAVVQATAIPAEFLHGAGESQIVAPDGTVLARGPRTGEAVVVAELELPQADDKRRPDGSDRFAARRPALYRAIGEPPVESLARPTAAERIEAAVWQPNVDGAAAIDDAVAALRASGAALLVLPELFCFQTGRVDEDLAGAAQRSEIAIAALTAACAPGQFVVTSLVTRDGGRFRHQALVIGDRGVVHRQPQLHAWHRHGWSVRTATDRTHVTMLPFGRIALLCGDDAIVPEAARLCAIAGAELLALPFDQQEPWESELGLVERAAENRVCLAAATRHGGLLCTLEEDFTIMTPWRHRQFDGLLSHPIVTRAMAAPGSLTRATLHPLRAGNKQVSRLTDVVSGRPWHLCGAITREPRIHV